MRPTEHRVSPRLAERAGLATLFVVFACACTDVERTSRAPTAPSPGAAGAELPRLVPSVDAGPVAVPGHEAPRFGGRSLEPELRRAIGSRLVDRARGRASRSNEAAGAPLGALLTPADANEEHERHVLLENTSTGVRALWVIRRGVIVNAAALGVVPLDWRIAGAGDFNSDGKEGVLWRNSATGGVAIWLMDAAGGVLAAPALGAVPAEWRMAGAGDYDSDGTDDILWEHTVSGLRAVWLIDGNGGVSSAPVLGSLDPEWRMAVAGDLESDGKDDILLRHSDGRLVLWLMAGGRPVNAVLLGTIPLEWQLVGTGDVDGDGKDDVLWEHTASGQRVAWLMNGAAGVSAASVLTVEATEWHVGAVLIPVKQPSAPPPLPAGSLDPSFSGTGKVVTTFPEVRPGAVAMAVALQADGKIVTAGGFLTGNGPFALARHNTDGSLDMSFGTGGRVTTEMATGWDIANAVAIQADGRIVVAGVANNGTSVQVGDFGLARYTATGSLDGSFGTGGRVTTEFRGGSDAAQAIAIQADGRIVAAGSAEHAGFALARYNTDGSLDATFGTGGKVTTFVGLVGGRISALTIQADGKLVVAGTAATTDVFNSDVAVARYNRDGSLDASFGSGGIVFTTFGPGGEVAYALAIQADGRIVVAGVAGEDSGRRQALVRYNTDGSLDMSFGTGGKVTAGTEADDIRAVAIQTDGKIVVAGIVPRDMAVFRYTTTGSPDATFGTNGRVITPFGSRFGHSFVNALVIQGDGKIVAAGHGNSGDCGLDCGFGLARYVP